MNDKVIRRGDVYYADLNPVLGSEQGGFRPVLIIQNNAGNYYSLTTIIAPITTAVKRQLPVHVNLGKNTYILDDGSIVLLEQIRVIDKSRLKTFQGSIYKNEMKRVDEALLKSIGLFENGGRK